MLTGKLLRNLYACSDHTATEMQVKNSADVNNYRPITTALSKILEPGTCGLQTANLVSSKHMGQKWPFLH